MIRHTLVMTQVRFFIEETTDPFKPYDAIATLTWETDDIVWLVGMHGRITRSLIRELAVLLDGMGVTTVKAHRASGHVLPRSTLIGPNLYEIKVSDVLKHFG